jgi:hypothetical protein
MTDILAKLRRAAWRGLEFPVSGREFGFQQEQAEHRYLFRDVQLIESLGKKNPTYRYTIPFREDIARGPWANLFTLVYPQFLAACQDRTRATLIDPVHGGVPAKCVSLRETLAVNRRDGVDVEVEYIFAPAETALDQTIQVQIRGIDGARGMAGAFDRNLAKVDWKQEPSPQPTINPLDFPASVLNQIEVGANQVNAAVADAAFRAEKANASLDRVKDISVAPALRQGKRLQAALIDFESKTDPTGQRPLRKLTTSVDYTVAALARRLGMGVDAFIKLNPLLARAPLIKANTQIKVFADTLKPENGRAA